MLNHFRLHNLIDFSNSKFLWKTHSGSYGQFEIESVCQIYNESLGSSETFYGLNQVMACDVYGENELFYDPSFSYQAIFSAKDCKRIRLFSSGKSHISLSEINADFEFAKPKLSYLENDRVEQCRTVEAVIEAAQSFNRLVCQLSWKVKGFGISIEFPVKHINYSKNLELFQIETGPLVSFPNTGSNPSDFSEINLAYIAIKNFSKIEFLYLDKASDELNVSYSRRETQEAAINLYKYLQ